MENIACRAEESGSNGNIRTSLAVRTREAGLTRHLAADLYAKADKSPQYV
jgi:hypothetical protein